MDTSETIGTLISKRNSYTISLVVVKSLTIKVFIYFVLFLLKGLPPLLQLDFGLRARVPPRFYFLLSPRSIFWTAQRFLILKHVTSGCMSPQSLFLDCSAVSPPKTRDFRLYEPAIPFFPPAQRFPIPNHVTSGCLSPQTLFPTGPRFPIPLPVMTSLDQSEARKSAIRAHFTTSVPESTINTNQVINEGLNLIHLARSINSLIGGKPCSTQTKWRT